MKVPDNDARHKYCPRGKDSWCKYQRDQATGESAYKTKINIPEGVRELIKPIFSHEDLGSADLLKKCLHGQTPNQMNHLLLVYGERHRKKFSLPGKH